jgi:1-acyl-sn-glycerol-3-phosphate acyltransferase
MIIYQSLPFGVRNRLTAAQAEDFMNEHPFIKFFARLNYASFNFSRTDNIMPSLEYAAERLDSGWHVLMAPEGTISPHGKLEKFKSGIGLLAVETKAPIVPVKIEGLFGTLPLHSKFPKKHSKVLLKIGQPIAFKKNTSYDKATKQLYKIMKKL